MKFKFTVFFVLAAIAFTIISLMSINDGYGSIKPAVYFFAYPFLSILWQSSISIYIFLIGILQYAFYGFLADFIKENKHKIIILSGLLILHLITAYWLANHLPANFH